MRCVAIVGSGQAGLQLAFGLLAHGYQVTLYSDRTPDQWLNHSRPNGAAFLFDHALRYERDLNMSPWEGQAPHGEGIHLTFLPEVGKITLTMQGRLVIKSVTRDDLEELTRANDLVIIAAGKGDLTGQLFARDPERSLYDKPQRHLTLITVTNTKPWSQIPFYPIKFTFIAPVGEMFWVPFYDKSQVASYSIV